MGGTGGAKRRPRGGNFGIGWQLGVPSIARKTDKGIPRYRDSQDSDIFILSGAEDLVPLLVESGGTWQRNVVTVGNEKRERYRPRVEGAFARIERITDTPTGNVFWRATTKDNVTSEYGKTAQARIAHPEHPKQVFRWLLEETRDDKGNIVRYEYKAEDLDGVPKAAGERHRHNGTVDITSNRYLKRILYGNKAGVSNPDEPADFHFEVVFDYGEHDATAPEPDDDDAWLARQDAFSSYRAGFELRTYRLCRRVLMFHRFDAFTSGPNPLLVRSTDLSYEESATITYLTRVTHRGYIWNATSSEYDATALPPVDFDYSRADLQSEVTDLDEASVRGIPGLIDGRAYQWVDLDGEGVPGVLCQHGGVMAYKRNLGEAKLAPARALATQPSFAAQSRSAQLLDVTGDGLPDLVDYSSPVHGFMPRKDDESWGRMRSFAALPNVNWNDPSLRFIDLDGDGFADVLMSGEHVYTWYPSLKADGFGPGRRASRYGDENLGPSVVFQEAEQTVFLADMSGDGLQDLVRVQNGSISYWPNLGYGRFGPKVVMGGAPHMAPSNHYAPSRVRLADIDGTGPADLVYIGEGGVKVWRNQSGNGFGAEESIGVFPDASALSTVDMVDMLGTGTLCLVWSTSLQGMPPRVRYVDLLGSVKPHLLTKVENNLGLETAIQYASSTKFYLEDRAQGVKWATRLPFPVQVVERLEHYDHVSKLRFVSSYRYRHGFYDAEEREFRGFGYVETRDAESVAQELGEGLFPDYPVLNEEIVLPPVVTKSWFHTGAWKKEQTLLETFESEWFTPTGGSYSEPRLSMPPMPVGLSPPERHQAHRALAGRLLRQEVYAEDGAAEQSRPYTVTQQTHEVRRLQPPDGAPYAAFYVVSPETLTIQYERKNPQPGQPGFVPPRFAHELRVDIDDLGYVKKSASVGYGHPDSSLPDAMNRTWVTLSEEKRFHKLDSTSWYRHGVPLWQKSWEADPALAHAGTLFTLAEITDAFSDTEEAYDYTGSLSGKRRRLSFRRERYWKNDLSAPLDVDEEVDLESLVLPYQSYVKALTANMLSATLEGEVGSSVVTDKGGYEDIESNGSYWAKTGITHYDETAFYLVSSVEDVFGNETLLTYDDEKLFVTEVEDEKENVTTATIDYRVLAPWKLTGINDNWREAKFDALGRVTEIRVVGKNGEGDPDGPTQRFTYELDRFAEDEGPARIKTERRETHDDPDTRWLVSISYGDGRGNEVMAKVSAEPGEAVELDGNGHPVIVSGELQYEEADPRWVGTGRTVFDNKGNPVKQYEPYFSATDEYEDDPDIVEWGVTPLLQYDPLGRVLRIDLPNGSYSRVEFDPWSQKSFDENDTVLETDNLWYEARDPGGSASDEEKEAAVKAAAHADTPTLTSFDGLGRPIVVVEHNIVDSSAEFYVTESSLDIQGNILEVIDPKERPCMTYIYSMLGQVLKQTSIDAGTRWRFDSAVGEAVRAWGERGFSFRFERDELRRLTEVWMDDGSTEKLVEELVYGEGHANEDAGNLRGKLVAHYDQAGVVKTESYDFKDNLLEQTRELADDYQNVLDWNAGTPPTLSGEEFLQSFAYDALDRPTSIVLPDDTDIRPSYNDAGLLESLEAFVRGAGSATSFIDGMDYDEKGRRKFVEWANGTDTTYQYDALTFRLSYFKTERGSDLLQSLQYTYDPVGNITKTVDTATLSVYFSNPPSSPIPDAGNDFTYDAIYRLIQAVGREHATGSDIQRDDLDMPIQAIPHPNNPSGLREYTQEYAYDEIGNITELAHTPTTGSGTWTREYTYDTTNDTNHLVTTTHSGGNKSYTHDAHGNMDGIPHLSAVDWDFADQLRHVEVTTGQDVYFVYDGTGQRVRKVWEHNGYRDERIYLGGFEIWRRTVVATETLQDERETVHIADDARRVCMIETLTVSGGSPPGTITARYRYELDNHLGTVCVECDQSGNVISFEEYHPYGTSAYRAFQSSEVSARRYRYTGKERDEETSLCYYGARYYAPWLGRWTAADPAGLVDGPGLYNYVRGSPVTLRDPNGMETPSLTLQQQDEVSGEGYKIGPEPQGSLPTPHATQPWKQPVVSTEVPEYTSPRGVKIESLGEGGPGPEKPPEEEPNLGSDWRAAFSLGFVEGSTGAEYVGPTPASPYFRHWRAGGRIVGGIVTFKLGTEIAATGTAIAVKTAPTGVGAAVGVGVATVGVGLQAIGIAGVARGLSLMIGDDEGGGKPGTSPEAPKRMQAGRSGHHAPAVRKSKGRPFEVARSDKSRPTIYSRGKDPAHDHWRIHEAERKTVGPRQGDFPGTDDELFDAYRRAYRNLDDIRVDVRSPDGKTVLAENVTPTQALDAIEKWLRQQGLR